MNPALLVTNLTVMYPGYTHAAVEDVSFEVREHSITALIGPNGSGKTTVLKAVLGLLEFEGEIRVFGKPVSQMYQTIGYVPQRFSFDPTFPITVSEFVSLAHVRSAGEGSEAHVRHTLDSVNAESLEQRKLSTLSGGQLQRVLLARALVNDPTLLLLDEPEAGVDVGGEQTFYDLIEKLVERRQVTALIASHELDVVYAYAQQVICLNRRMLCSGKPRDVLNQETFEKLYGRGLKFYGHDHTVHHTHKRQTDD